MTLCDLTSIFDHYHFNQAVPEQVKLKDDRSLTGAEAANNIVAMTARGLEITSHSP